MPQMLEAASPLMGWGHRLNRGSKLSPNIYLSFLTGVEYDQLPLAPTMNVKKPSSI